MCELSPHGLWGCLYDCHSRFTDRETETGRGQETCPGDVHSQAQPKFVLVTDQKPLPPAFH